MIRYYIRLYKPHDLDLIMYYAKYKFNIASAAYKCGKAFCKGEFFVINFPPPRDTPLRTNKKIFTYLLKLDEKRDADIIRLLNKIAPGYRNNFLKNLLRLYLFYPMTEEYLIDPEDISEFRMLLSAYRKKQRIVNIAEKSKSDMSEKPKSADKRTENRPPDIEKKAENSVTLDNTKKYVDANNISPEDPIEESATSQGDDLTELFSSLI